MIVIKSSREIALMKEAGKILANVFDILEPLCVPGTTTKHLSEVAEKVIRDAGAIPAEKGYYALLLMKWLFMVSLETVNSRMATLYLVISSSNIKDIWLMHVEHLK